MKKAKTVKLPNRLDGSLQQVALADGRLYGCNGSGDPDGPGIGLKTLLKIKAKLPRASALSKDAEILQAEKDANSDKWSQARDRLEEINREREKLEAQVKVYSREYGELCSKMDALQNRMEGLDFSDGHPVSFGLYRVSVGCKRVTYKQAMPTVNRLIALLRKGKAKR